MSRPPGQAWDPVPADSPIAPSAAMARARQELESPSPCRSRAAACSGRSRAGAPISIEAFETLVHLFKIEGRFREARRLVLRWWEHYPNRTGVLKELAHLEKPNPYAPDRARETLTLRRGRLHRMMTRICLGFANLAIRGNDFAEAERRLRHVRAEASGRSGHRPRLADAGPGHIERRGCEDGPGPSATGRSSTPTRFSA